MYMNSRTRASFVLASRFLLSILLADHALLGEVLCCSVYAS